MRMPRYALPILSVALLVPRAAAASVLVVAHTGAPYSTIQSAIDAAQDGDTVLVRNGVYSETPLIDGKSISVCADHESLAQIMNTGTIQISNIAPGQCALFSGFLFNPAYQGGLRVLNCGGSVRLVGLGMVQTQAAQDDGVRVWSCQDVLIARCSLRGADCISNYAPTYAGIGLDIVSSRVAIHDATVLGGRGANAFPMGMGGFWYSPVAGAIAGRIDSSSTVFLSGCTFQGGTGGTGYSAMCYPGPVGGGPGAPGGTGLQVSSLQTYILDSQVTGGTGGFGGAAAPSCGMPGGPQGPNGADISGSPVQLTGSARVFSCSALVRENQLLGLNSTGQPGDDVWAVISLQPNWVLDLPFQGVRLFAQPARRVYLGTIPSTGTLGYSLVMPALPPLLECRRFHLQGFFRDSSGVFHLGSGAVAVELETGF